MTSTDDLSATRIGGRCSSGAASVVPVVLLAVAAHFVGTPLAVAAGGPSRIGATEDERPAPSGSPYETALCGAVESLPQSRALGGWTANGTVLHVGVSTVIDETQGSVALGVSVLVEGNAELDGSVMATRIAVRAAGCGDLSGAVSGAPGLVSPDYLALGALTGTRPGTAGVAVALIRGDAHELALGVRGLEPDRQYVVVIDGTAAVSVTASESGLIRVEMLNAPADDEAALPDILLPVSGLLRVELLDSSGAVGVSGELRAVALPLPKGNAQEFRLALHR